MIYKKYRYLDSDIHTILQENEDIGLAQSDKVYKLSGFSYNNETPRAIMNCSYFHNGSDGTWVVGRNQGDLKNETTDKGGYQLVYDTEWHFGEFKSWDYTENVKCGFSVATCLIQDGKDVELCSTEIISDAKSKLSVINKQSAIAIVNGKALFIVVDGKTESNKGISGRQLRDFVKENFDAQFLCQLDGGGSSEMIVEEEIVNELSSERKMLNGLCLVGGYEEMDSVLVFSNGTEDKLSNISQKEGIGTHDVCYANDFNGDGSKDKMYLKAPYDCKVKAIATSDNTCLFESLGKVRTPKGTDYAWFLCCHCDDLTEFGIKVGKVFKKDELCYREGTKGNASGNHIHFQCGLGRYKNLNKNLPYYWNGKYCYGGKYKYYEPCIEGSEEHIYDMFYLADIETKNNIKSIYDWKYLGGIPVPTQRNEKVNQIKVSVNKLRIRSSMSTKDTSNVVGYCEKGYYDAEKLDGWYQIGSYYVANIDGVEWLPKEDEDIDYLKAKIKSLESEIASLEEKLEDTQTERDTFKNALVKINEECEVIR